MSSSRTLSSASSRLWLMSYCPSLICVRSSETLFWRISGIVAINLRSLPSGVELILSKNSSSKGSCCIWVKREKRVVCVSGVWSAFLTWKSGVFIIFTCFSGPVTRSPFVARQPGGWGYSIPNHLLVFISSRPL